MNKIAIDELISLYDLRKHPEGGFFKETYRSKDIISQNALPEIFSGDRSLLTAIYFLLPKGEKSHLHRIKSDEIWHFYLGGPLTLVQISQTGEVQKYVLGQDVKSGHKLQHVIPAGCWFGAYSNLGSEFSFVGCTVAPGFDFKDFEMGNRGELVKQFPNAQDVIEFLTI